jgi:hypothetical protein
VDERLKWRMKHEESTRLIDIKRFLFALDLRGKNRVKNVSIPEMAVPWVDSFLTVGWHV